MLAHLSPKKCPLVVSFAGVSLLVCNYDCDCVSTHVYVHAYVSACARACVRLDKPALASVEIFACVLLF